MPRQARKIGSSSVFHVVSRGCSRQIIFEDDNDRAFFMTRLRACLKSFGGSLLCWCLMDNHFHLLVKMENGHLSDFMHHLLSGYAGYFNRLHGRSGPLFEGRFKSEPVDADSYFLDVVRYIHWNPVKAGISRGLSYPWSSYDVLAASDAAWRDGSFVVDIFGGVEQFKQFHLAENEATRVMDAFQRVRRLFSDREALSVARSALGGADPGLLNGCDRKVRDSGIAKLKDAGLTVRQIQRITGISLGTISRAKASAEG